MNRVDWTKWSAIAEIMSALAIVVTLLYLADQTRELRLQSEQNNLLMRSQTRSEISNSIVDLLLRSANSDFIADQIFPEEIETRGGVQTLRFLNLPSMKRVFCSYQNALEPSFAAELSSLLEKPC